MKEMKHPKEGCLKSPRENLVFHKENILEVKSLTGDRSEEARRYGGRNMDNWK